MDLTRKKKKNLWKRVRKPFGIGFLILFCIGGVLLFLSFGPFDETPEEVFWGITFSRPYAKSLGINWQEAYLALLDDVGVRSLRIPVYWNEIEPWEGKFLFEDVDWQIAEAKKRNARVVLSIGRRVPRWPECHVPLWAKELGEASQQEKTLAMLRRVVLRYRDEDAVKYWQVENEPFFPHFGICPEPDDEFFKREVELVRSLDSREIIVSDSGELSTWWKATRYADIFGTTMYRLVPHLDKTCCAKYPLPPWFYRKKANALSHVHSFDRFIVVELQAEPWAATKFITEMTDEEIHQWMSLGQFRENIQYARDAKIPEVYLWGAEWWYWFKEVRGNSEIWDEARRVFQSGL